MIKIYVTNNFIYKVELTGNEEKPLAITKEYYHAPKNQWKPTSEKNVPNVGMFIKNQGGVDALLSKCIDVKATHEGSEDLQSWVDSYNAASKELHEKNHAKAMHEKSLHEARIKSEYERLFCHEITETNEETVETLLLYLNTQNWGLWQLPKMTIGYACHQYDCDGKTATTIKLDVPIIVNGEAGTMFQVGAPHGHLTKYKRI